MQGSINTSQSNMLNPTLKFWVLSPWNDALYAYTYVAIQINDIPNNKAAGQILTCISIGMIVNEYWKIQIGTSNTTLVSSGRQLTILSSFSSLHWHSYSSSSSVECSTWPGGQGVIVKLKYWTC